MKSKGRPPCRASRRLPGRPLFLIAIAAFPFDIGPLD